MQQHGKASNNNNVANGGANNLNNYKTKICRHYQVGKCKLGTLCNFAHGDVDVRESRHTDSGVQSQHDSSAMGGNTHGGDAYERILLLENRMDATFVTQRALLAQLKQLSSGGNARVPRVS